MRLKRPPAETAGLFGDALGAWHVKGLRVERGDEPGRVAGLERDYDVHVTRETRLAVHHRRDRAGDHVRDVELVERDDEETDEIRRVGHRTAPGPAR